jgi:hypothetical protein
MRKLLRDELKVRNMRGNAGIRILGILGGLVGILIGAGEFMLWVFSGGQLPIGLVGSGLISP